MQINNYVSNLQTGLRSIGNSIQKVDENDSMKEESFGYILRDRESIDRNEVQKMLSGNTKVVDKLVASQSKVPYSHLMNEQGEIEYNGVTFQTDELKGYIGLGDLSDSKNVIVIPLTEGGTLRVNRDSIDALSDALGMFSPSDVNRILDALAADAKMQADKLQAEDEAYKTITNLNNSDE